MKKHSPLSRKQILFSISFLFLFCGMALFLFSYQRDEKRFTNITNELFINEMKANTLNMHYTLAYPENFGVYDYKPVLSCYDSGAAMGSQAETENILAALNSLHTENLSDTDAYLWKLLVRSLENSLALNSFAYYSEPFSPASGTQSQLPILFAEYTFRSKRDVEDYLALLDQTDEYFASLLTYEQEKAAAGLSMPAAFLKDVREQCDTIITKEALDAGTHFLQTTFQERLGNLYQSGIITNSEMQGYLSQNDRLLKTVLLPAYVSLGDGLLLLEDNSIQPSGLAALPEGKAYYEQLLISETGSYRPIEEIQELLAEQFSAEYNAIRNIVTKYPDIVNLYNEETSAAFPYTDASQMLLDLQKRMRKDFPAFPKDDTLPKDGASQKSNVLLESGVRSKDGALPDATSLPKDTASPDDTTLPKSDSLPENNVLSDSDSLPGSAIRVSIKSVSKSLEEYCAPAFYLTTPIDDTDSNSIYINLLKTPGGLDLYTTLAHEGYPGHLYQAVYYNRSAYAAGERPVRRLLWYGGYLEGWGLYVELLSYDYASQLLMEQNQKAMALTAQLEKHNRSLQLCLYSLIDIMIHYQNATYSQIAKVLESFGISDSASITSIYNYIVQEPCNYLKYYLGYLEVLSLQQNAKELWGEEYTDYRFHTFYLDCGPSDFLSLQERLAAEAQAKRQSP